jgi:hypothetical protein
MSNPNTDARTATDEVASADSDEPAFPQAAPCQDYRAGQRMPRTSSAPVGCPAGLSLASSPRGKGNGWRS